MNLEQFYELTNSGTRVFKIDDNNNEEELHINQDTECWLYKVLGFEAETNDLMFVYVK